MNPLKSQLQFKTISYENKTYLVFSAGKNDKINYSEVQTLEEKSYHEYFLPMQCISNGRKNRIKYDISGYTSVSELLRTEIEQKHYFDVISGIQKVLSFCQRSHFSVDNLMCDPKYIYCHNVSKIIMMVYMPLDNKSFVHDDIPKCLRKMHKMAKIKVSDYHYKSEYEKFINSFQSDSKNKEFNPAALLHFLNSNRMVCFEKSGKEENKKVPETTDSSSFPINAQLAYTEPDIDDIPEDEDTSGNTVVRHRGCDAYFTDSDGNRIDIEDFPFSIGRNKRNNLVIDEPTVSSEHAVLTAIAGKYFIEDSSSSNGTFLNDEDNQISSSELHNGDRVYFDSFCYVFHSVREESSEDEDCTRTVVVSRRKENEEDEPEVIEEVTETEESDEEETEVTEEVAEAEESDEEEPEVTEEVAEAEESDEEEPEVTEEVAETEEAVEEEPEVTEEVAETEEAAEEEPEAIEEVTETEEAAEEEPEVIEEVAEIEETAEEEPEVIEEAAETEEADEEEPEAIEEAAETEEADEEEPELIEEVAETEEADEEESEVTEEAAETEEADEEEPEVIEESAETEEADEEEPEVIEEVTETEEAAEEEPEAIEEVAETEEPAAPEEKTVKEKKQVEKCTVVDAKALAYLQKVSDNTIVNITSFPYICITDEGVMITSDIIGTRRRMFVENISSDALFFEGMVIPAGRKAEMFSGCSLTIAGEKYHFRVNK